MQCCLKGFNCLETANARVYGETAADMNRAAVAIAAAQRLARKKPCVNIPKTFNALPNFHCLCVLFFS